MQAAAPTDATLLSDLLADAKCVALYAQRSGVLNDAVLGRAIYEVENLSTKSWQDEAVLNLQIAFNKTMRELWPTTLDDLKGPYAPYRRTRWLALQSLIFVVVSLVFVVIAAWCTLTYNYGSALIGSIEREQDARVETRISSLVRQIVADENNYDEATDSASAAAENYLLKLEEMRELDRQANVSHVAASQYLAKNSIVSTLFLGNLDDWRKLFLSAFGQSSNPTSARARPENYGQFDVCAEPEKAPDPTLITAAFSRTKVAALMRTQAQRGIEVTCLNRLTYHVFDYPRFPEMLDQLRYVVNVYGLWIVPALYGALGAAMYHMRRVLNPTVPNPSPLRVLHRVTVGAFAGIIVAWFWAPNGQSTEDFQNIGFNLFAAAFLVGYSIDVFFALLDRLVTNVTSSIGRIGTETKAG